MKHDKNCQISSAKGAKGWAASVPPVCTCTQPPEELHDGVAMTEFPEKREWEERLAKFGGDILDYEGELRTDGIKRLKSFIRTLLARAKEEERHLIKKELVDIINNYGNKKENLQDMQEN